MCDAVCGVCVIVCVFLFKLFVRVACGLLRCCTVCDLFACFVACVVCVGLGVFCVRVFCLKLIV